MKLSRRRGIEDDGTGDIVAEGTIRCSNLDVLNLAATYTTGSFVILSASSLSVTGSATFATASFTTASFTSADFINLTVTNLTAANQSVTNLTASNLTVSSGNFTSANFTNLTASNASFSSGSFTSANFVNLSTTNLTASYANITSGGFNSANFTNLTASAASVTSGTFYSLVVTNLVVVSSASVPGLGTVGSGGSTWSLVQKTANYTATSNDYTIECTSGTFTVTLPTAVSISGKVYVIKNSGSGQISIATTSSQTIDAYTSGVRKLNQYDSLIVQSNGSNWIII